MSWLRNTSLSLARQLSRSLDPRHDYEPQACYSSFCKHWQQAHDIIAKSHPSHLHDDVLGVVNHLEQLTTLLTLEARARELHSASSPAECLEYLLSENLLDKLYEWAILTGKYENAVRLEQLKLFGNLVSHYSTQVIAAEPFLRPLLKLLSSFRNELPPPNLESQLVTVLNQICVALMQNMTFVDLFFLTNHAHNGSHSEFIIVRLLLSSVHREGSSGATARDALLLCATMSPRSKQLQQYMLAGNTCPVLATGLSGLYSLLPRTLNEKIYRLTPDDVNHVNKLTLFIDSLEFCNAVAQVAHPSIRKHLLDLLYQGFLVPVMGPALLQTRATPLQSGVAEQAAATAYLELLLRCVSERGLLRAVLHFLFIYEYDGIKVIDVMLRRLEGTSQLSMVSLSLMETLVSLNSEDVLVELAYKYLLSGQHLAVAHRHRITSPEPYRNAAVAFLDLSPNCCSRPLEKTRRWVEELALSGRRVLDYRPQDERRVNGVHDDLVMSPLVHDLKFYYGNPNESLIGNYHAYLCDARFEIVSRTMACSNWTSKYDHITLKRETNNNKETRDTTENAKEQDSLISICTSEYDTLKTSDSSEKEQHSLTSLTEVVENEIKNDEANHDSLISIGDSSDYESFKNYDDVFAEEMFRKRIGRVEEAREYEEVTVRSWRVSAETVIGPLISSLLKKTALLLESEITVNSRVTSIISKLASLPTPLLTSLLLCPGYLLQPNVPSLFQVLSKLKEEVDELTAQIDNSDELVDKARVFLMQRELTLLNARAPTNDEMHLVTCVDKTYVRNIQTNRLQKTVLLADKPEKKKLNKRNTLTTVFPIMGILRYILSQAHSRSSMQVDDSPFRRVEPKRRSISTSLSNMFHRRLSSSPSQLNHSINHSPSPQKRPIFTQDSYWSQSITLRSIMNAVLLDEWLKELAALCEEHALRLSADCYEDDSYIRTVAL